MYTGTSSELGKSTKDTVNPLYHTSTITDDHKKEVLKHVIKHVCDRLHWEDVWLHCLL